MNIAIASGKGGTGKTTIATSLAHALAQTQISTQFFDCDVEAPNAHIFLHPSLTQEEKVELLIPQVNEEKCTSCGKCASVCQYNAILILGKPLIFPELCHSCGACLLACPESAITEVPKQIGKLASGFTPDHIHFHHGLLDIGQPMAVPIISELKQQLSSQSDHINIIDAPPGTSCPVVETIRNTDFVILVSEPNPFGLHDLKLAHQLVQELNLPAGLIINKDEPGFSQLEEYCQGNHLDILMRIPFKKEYSHQISEGKLLDQLDPTLNTQFTTLIKTIENKIHQSKDSA
jgi:MinD superfamily P-loop ATPase